MGVKRDTTYTYDERDGEIVAEESSERWSPDHKGRSDVRHMSDRQLLVELVTRLRVLEDLTVQFVDQMGNNPVLKAMAMGGGIFSRGGK